MKMTLSEMLRLVADAVEGTEVDEATLLDSGRMIRLGVHRRAAVCKAMHLHEFAVDPKAAASEDIRAAAAALEADQ